MDMDWYCEKVRHKKDKCYKRNREHKDSTTKKLREASRCWTCAKKGHWARECHKKPPMEEECPPLQGKLRKAGVEG